MLSPFMQKQLLSHLYGVEAYRRFAYDDATGQTIKAPKGLLTIGIGWNIQLNGCPKEIAEFAAMYFIKQFDTQLANKISFYDSLDEVRRAVLCSMAFNMGVDNVLEFVNMLDAMRKADWRTAAIAMLSSKWAKQVGSRAVKLSSMMEIGQWV